MGEAKRTQAALRATIIAELEGWCFAPSEQEALIVTDLSTIQPVIVKRLPEDYLRQQGMKPKDCHNNCQSYAAQDLDHEITQRLGWIDGGDFYVLHSVIHYKNQYLCVTPMVSRVFSSHFDFLPDGAIDFTQDKSTGDWQFTRNGYRISRGVRKYPDVMTRQCRHRIDELRAGGNVQRIILSGLV